MFVVAMQTLQTVKRHSTFYLFIFVKFNNLFAKSNNFKLPLFFFHSYGLDVDSIQNLFKEQL